MVSVLIGSVPIHGHVVPMLAVARIGAVAMIIGGLVGAVGAGMRIDSYETMPGWLWIFAVGWIGVYVLYPVAMFALGRSLLER